MAICAGALKRYLADYDCKPDKPLIAAVPVSLREPGNTDANNQVSTMLVSLCTDIDDRVQRLMAIHASSQQGKKQMGSIRALPTDFPSLGAPWLLSGLAALAGRAKLAERLPPLINVLISNVPGPQFPLYFAGAKLADLLPGVDSGAWRRAEHDGAELQRLARVRPDRLPARVARRRRPGRLRGRRAPQAAAADAAPAGGAGRCPRRPRRPRPPQPHRPEAAPAKLRRDTARPTHRAHGAEPRKAAAD